MAKKIAGPAKYAGNLTPARRRLLTQRFKTVPYPNYLGMKIKTMQPGHVILSFRVTENLKQYQGLLHGGAMASIADTAATFAALTIIPEELDLITVEMKGNFLASVDKGTVTAEADVLHLGQRTSVIECSLFGRNRRLLWKGTFTCLHFPSEMNITG
ncbi:PaaI family thioesterase [Candidatus Zixiibacteriota bacterium]